jgi:ABC-type uncharacterized transport system substrate-binding protein
VQDHPKNTENKTDERLQLSGDRPKEHRGRNKRPDVLVARSTPTTAALKKETGTIPIIFVNVIEPVEQGFVQSLARPGENMTGFTNMDAPEGTLFRTVALGLMRSGP